MDSAYEQYISTLRDATKSNHEISYEQRRVGDATGEITYDECDPKLSYNLTNSHRESYIDKTSQLNSNPYRTERLDKPDR